VSKHITNIGYLTADITRKEMNINEDHWYQTQNWKRPQG